MTDNIKRTCDDDAERIELRKASDDLDYALRSNNFEAAEEARKKISQILGVEGWDVL